MTEHPADVTVDVPASRTDRAGLTIVSERFWCGGKYPVCAVLVRSDDGLKAFIGGTESAWAVRWHGTRLDPGLAMVLFPAYRSQKWAGW